MKPLVIIGFSEALSAPEVAWSLLDAGFEVISFARRGRRAALRHSVDITVHDITPPEEDCAATVADLEKLLSGFGASNRAVLCFPLDDASIWLCNELKSASGWRLIGPQGADISLALNKRVQVEAAQSAGLKVPATTIATTPDQVLARSGDLPLILRPADAILFRQGQLHKGRNWICATEAELRQTVSEWAGAMPLLVQPFVDGVGEGVFGFATESGILGWSAHRRLRMMNPHGSGSSACVSQPVPNAVQHGIEELIKQTGWRGLFMVELLCDRAGEHWFVEFNGRPWGSMALACDQGLAYPAWAATHVLHPNKPIAVPAPDSRPLTCRNVGREMMHFVFVLRGPKSKALSHWPSVWRTVLDLLRVTRRDSLYNWRRGDLRVFFWDVWYTLRSYLR